jgi:hypothetical protein
MAHIRNDDKLTFDKTENAIRYVKNLDGRVRFQVNVTAFLPTENERGFEGSTFITISRATFQKVIADMGRTLVDDRGAKIVLRVTASTGYGGLSFVSLY